MHWYYVIFGFVLCGVALSFEKDERLRRYLQMLYLPFLLFVLVMFVGLRSASPDFNAYSDWFDWVSAGHLVAQDWAKDPAFVLVSSIVSALGISFAGVTLVFAILTLGSQLYFSTLASDPKWVTLFVYVVVCRTLIGSDMASIRSAVAIPLMSISVLLAFRGKRKSALLLYIVALTFHLSVLIGLLPFLLVMCRVQFHSRWWILSVGIVGIVAKGWLQDIVGLLSNSRTEGYIEHLNVSKGPPSGYYIYIAIRLLILTLIVMLYWNKIGAESRLALFFFSIGISLQILFIWNNALSWRTSDIFGMFDVMVMMLPLKLTKGYNRLLYAAGLVVFGLALFQFGMKDAEPYRWILA